MALERTEHVEPGMFPERRLQVHLAAPIRPNDANDLLYVLDKFLGSEISDPVADARALAEAVLANDPSPEAERNARRLVEWHEHFTKAAKPASRTEYRIGFYHARLIALLQAVPAIEGRKLCARWFGSWIPTTRKLERAILDYLNGKDFVDLRSFVKSIWPEPYHLDRKQSYDTALSRVRSAIDAVNPALPKPRIRSEEVRISPDS